MSRLTFTGTRHTKNLLEARPSLPVRPVPGRCSAILTSATSFLRAIPLFFASTPKTPLRVLCVIAFDTLHVMRHARPMSQDKLTALAALLDFGACANAALDGKHYCRTEYDENWQKLQNAGLELLVDDYLSRLRNLEIQRPSPGGDDQRFGEIRTYREAVARISLGLIAAATLGDADSGFHGGMVDSESFHADTELDALFRIVMLCQIIDDVIDYPTDLSAALPGFLTATASLPRALALTAQAGKEYATGITRTKTGAIFPLRIALILVSVITRLITWICHRGKFEIPADQNCESELADNLTAAPS